MADFFFFLLIPVITIPYLLVISVEQSDQAIGFIKVLFNEVDKHFTHFSFYALAIMGVNYIIFLLLELFFKTFLA